ncbi:MAG: penicillin-binding protein 2 [Anaerolineae bacterium]
MRHVPATRLFLLQALIGLAAAALIGRLWQLQMVTGEKYRLLSDRNRLRQVEISAPRGVIYDSRGQILARNRPSFSIVVIPADLPKNEAGEPDEDQQAVLLDRLSAILTAPVPGTTATPQPTPASSAVNQAGAGADSEAVFVIREREPWVMPRAEIEREIADALLGGAYRPITVARHVKEETAFLVAEEAVNLPGVQLELEPIRDYPTGALTSHIIGHMGHIPQEQLETYRALGYRINDQIGLTGLEATFEAELRGVPGRQLIEVDVHGRPVRTIGQGNPAVPGHNLVLNIDVELQRIATEALRAVLENSSGFTKATQGAVVALDPRNGKVLALVSLPSYDNNLFAKGITAEAWQALNTDPDLPLFDRAVGGQYPPGSVFKIIVAAAALQEGVISPRTLLGDGFDGRNDGIIWLPNQYFPWDLSLAQPFYSWTHKYGYGHGLHSVKDALAVSDDIFFYLLGGGYPERYKGLGSKKIGEYARAFGLGAPTGIELLGEAKGLVPDSRWKRLNYAENWLTGDTYNMSIGQGYILASPLQMANATAAVANRGYLWKPQLVDYITDDQGNAVRPFQPVLLREVPVDPGILDVVREGMYGAVNWPRGTATRVRVPGVAVAGKTGTAEYFRDDNKDGKEDRDSKGNLPTHAWFSCFAPYIDPEIVVTVFVANGGEGSSVAAPVAAQVLNAYFAGKGTQASR